MADRPRPPRGPFATTPPTPPRGPLAGHESHDPMLVSSLAAGDLAGTERERAEAQVAACTDCAELAADIRLLAAATRAAPTPPRPRDFSLSPADAARLRPTGLRALVAAIAAPRSLARPLSATLTTLGVAGLLLAALPLASPGAFMAGAPSAASPVAGTADDGSRVAPMSVPSGPDTQAEQNAGGAQPSAAAASAPAGAAGPEATRDTSLGLQAIPPHAGSVPSHEASPAATSALDTRLLLVLVSLACLATGVGLALVRRHAIRSGLA